MTVRTLLGIIITVFCVIMGAIDIVHGSYVLAGVMVACVALNIWTLAKYCKW